MGIRPQRWRVEEVREAAVGRRRWEDLWVEVVCLRVAGWAPVLAVEAWARALEAVAEEERWAALAATVGTRARWVGAAA